MLTMHTPQPRSNASVTPHLNLSSRRQSQTHMPAHLLLSSPYVLPHVAATIHINSPLATDLLKTHTTQTTSNKLVTPHLITFYRPQQQIFMLTSFVPFLSCTVLCTFAAKPIHSSHPPNLLTTHDPQKRSNMSVTPHPFTVPHSHFQAHKPTHLVLFTPYIVTLTPIIKPLNSPPPKICCLRRG